MEAYRWLGVTKIITYAYPNLNADARKVLEYYARTGFLDLYSYELADIEKFPRNIKKQCPQTWTDLKITILHSYELCRGYDYFSIIDWDEFIIPNKNITLLNLVSTFLSQHLNVYGIRFLTQFYIGAGGDTSKSIFLTQHRTRAVKEPKWNRPKFIFHPSDIELAFTSVLIPKDKRKKRFDLPADIAFLRHYRRCIPKPTDANACIANPVTVRDNTVARWADRTIASDVLDKTLQIQQECK